MSLIDKLYSYPSWVFDGGPYGRRVNPYSGLEIDEDTFKQKFDNTWSGDKSATVHSFPKVGGRLQLIRRSSDGDNNLQRQTAIVNAEAYRAYVYRLRLGLAAVAGVLIGLAPTTLSLIK